MAKKKTVRKLTTWAQWTAGAVSTVSVAVEAIDKVRSWFVARAPAPVAMVKSMGDVLAEPGPVLHAPPRPDHSLTYMLVLTGVGVASVLLVRFLGRHWESKALD